MEEFGTTLNPMQQKKKRGNQPLPTLTIIAHPDPLRMGEYAVLSPLAAGKKVELSRTAPHFNKQGRAMGAPLGDPYVSRNPMVLKTAGDGVLLDCGSTSTHVTAGRDRITETRIFSGEDLNKGVVLVLGERVVVLLHWTRKEEDRTANDYGFVGVSDGMVTLREEIEKVTRLNTPVLLRGESGTGKELTARAIHEGGRKGRPFVCVNMGAIPPSLAASELFGAVRGSFTGASRDQGGYFKAAEGGTLFLDEIGEASPEVQVMLLRALESGEISPVGAQQTFKVNTRLIAATDANLESKMKEDSFKTPLFHRLAGYEIHLPPLRERLEDFGRLFLHFVQAELKESRELGPLKTAGPQDEPWLPPSLALRLLEYSWPGNIRQLRNAVRQLVIGCSKDAVLWMVPKLEEMLANKPSPADTPQAAPARRKPSAIPKDEFLASLKANGWDLQLTADALGVSRGAVYQLMAKVPDLKKAADLSAAEINAALEDHPDDLAAAANALRVSRRALRRRITQLDKEKQTRST